jgi:geranylgeranyl diphosphate synthase type II
MKLPERFEEYRRLLHQFLEWVVPAENAPPEPIHRAMRYSLFAGGKRLRPVLCMAVAETLGGKAEELLPVAAAIEMIHTYSLIHDDLPAMDNDDFRRGKPTNHKVFGDAIAILAGDALLTVSFETLLRGNYEPSIRCRLVQMLTAAAGTCGMIGGQVVDMVHETKGLSMQELQQLHSMKTGAMIRFSVQAPAVALKSGETVESALVNYGSALGLAFQIVDDILDVESTTEVLGKTAGKDQKSGKVTYPSLIGVDESRKMAGTLIDEACAAVATFDRHSYLKLLARHVLERES